MNKKDRGPLGIGNFRLYTEKGKDQYIGALVSEWQKGKTAEKAKKETLPFITLSRQFGCMTLETGLRLAERLNRMNTPDPKWAVYDKDQVFL